jgi:hypothetical protein
LDLRFDLGGIDCRYVRVLLLGVLAEQKKTDRIEEEVGDVVG